MKKYTYPLIQIALFNNEEVAVTASVADMSAFNAWEEQQKINNGYSIERRMVDFAKTLEFTD